MAQPLPATKENVDQILRSVREGIRTYADLEACGCPACQEALNRIDGESMGDDKKAERPDWPPPQGTTGYEGLANEAWVNRAMTYIEQTEKERDFYQHAYHAAQDRRLFKLEQQAHIHDEEGRVAELEEDGDYGHIEYVSPEAIRPTSTISKEEFVHLVHVAINKYWELTEGPATFDKWEQIVRAICDELDRREVP